MNRNLHRRAHSAQPRTGDCTYSLCPDRCLVCRGGSGDGDDEELEELAKKLYPKLRHKLQAGLLIERERAGKLTDLF